jgi:hypothetical protein
VTVGNDRYCCGGLYADDIVLIARNKDQVKKKSC